MKKKKGFTLIELLAVIVVLAIIALIATPIVMNTIKNSKKGAAERSGESYTKQVELTIATEELDKRYVEDGEYKITSDGNLCRDKSATCSDKDKITIEMSGTKPNDGTVKIEKGQVSTTGTSMNFGDYIVSYDETKKTYVAKVVEILCTAKTTVTNGNKAEGNYNYGDEYSCELGDGEAKTFYVLETSGDNVSLIMNKNVGSDGKGTIEGNTVAWSSDGDNSNGPVTALSYLASSTARWSKLNPSQISLPTKDQIYVAAGNTVSLPTWLRENLNVNDSVPYAYWTSTPSPNMSGSTLAWIVDLDGILNDYYVDRDSSLGVRPVITISKDNLSY